MPEEFKPEPLKPTQVPPEPAIENPKSRRICAWCKKDLGPANTEGDTHGICEDCLKNELNDAGLV